MKSYSDFLSEVSSDSKKVASELVSNTCPQLNGLQSITCSSSNPDDEKHVKKIEVEQTDTW